MVNSYICVRLYLVFANFDPYHYVRFHRTQSITLPFFTLGAELTKLAIVELTTVSWPLGATKPTCEAGSEPTEEPPWTLAVSSLSKTLILGGLGTPWSRLGLDFVFPSE